MNDIYYYIHLKQQLLICVIKETESDVANTKQRNKEYPLYSTIKSNLFIEHRAFWLFLHAGLFFKCRDSLM